MRTLMLVPICKNFGLTTLILGLIKKFQKNGRKVKFFKPILKNLYNDSSGMDHTTEILTKMCSIECLTPINITCIDNFFMEGNKTNIIESILLKINSEKNFSDIMLIEGIHYKHSFFLSNLINYEIAQAINAEIIFFSTLERHNVSDIENVINIINQYFLSKKNINIRGIILNNVKTLELNLFNDISRYSSSIEISKEVNDTYSLWKKLSYKYFNIPMLGYIPWNSKLIEPTIDEIANYLRADVISQCDLGSFFIKFVLMYKKKKLLQYCNNYFSNSVLISSLNDFYNFDDLENTFKDINYSGFSNVILLTNVTLCFKNFVKASNLFKKINFSVLLVEQDIIQTILLLRRFDFKISTKNFKKFKVVQEYVSNYVNDNIISLFKNLNTYKYQMCPSVFIHNIMSLSKVKKKTIILPEGKELRIIKAASICADQNIATCVLLGNPREIIEIFKFNNIKFKSNIKILDPELVRDNYIERLIYLRKKYKMTIENAKKVLKDDTVLSTLILESGIVDGLVSGSANTTSSTILPALQLIKVSKNNSLISSVFFMLLSDHVLLYADCAINPDPNANQLAEIAIQSANTAMSFGILPKIAMLSYATGTSSNGIKIDKVREATNIVKKKFPNLIVEGPIQYDAAIDNIVSRLKCPSSVVGGDATVFIFPDLNSGNITYKAVQRSTNTIAIGPILQGINKPVNDLSRGASVQDIVYTIAITAIQCSQK